MNHTKQFFNIVKPDKGYLEIRLVPLQKQMDSEFWDKLKQLHNILLPSTIVKKQVCIFVKDYEDVDKIINFDEGYFNTHTKICYGINERFKNEDYIDGSYKSLKKFRFIFFDIDKVDHSNILDWEKKFLKMFVDDLIKDLEIYKLYQPTIISSGAGIHILYKIKEVDITDGRKRWFKQWMKKLEKQYSNNMFELDAVSDATRIFSLPGSRNNKRGKNVEILKYSEVVNNFKFKSKQQLKIKPLDEETIKNLPKISESIEWKLLMRNDLPKGDIHSKLIFALKLLIKAKGINNWQIIERKLNQVRHTNHILNPNIGTDGKTYNKGIVMNWLITHKNWVKTKTFKY